MSPEMMWIAGGGLAAAFVVLLLAWRIPHRRRSHGHAPAQAWTADAARPAAWAQPGSDKLRKDVDRQANDIQELRATLNHRVKLLEQRMETVERAARTRPADAGPILPTPRPARDPYPAEPGGYGEVSIGYGAAPGRRPGAGDLPVEVRDGAVVTSDALPPAAFVVPDGLGRGRVFLNPDVPLNEFALPKWEEFFELRTRQPYAAYRTLTPAEVAWDSLAGRGKLVTRGMAEAL